MSGTPPRRILLVDDEDAVRFGMREFLRTKGYAVDEADSCRAAEESFRGTAPDAVVLDHHLPDGTALELLPRLRQIDASVPVAVLTGHGSIDLAVEAVKLGAEHFLTKPVELPALLVILERMVERRRNENKRLVEAARGKSTERDPFLGTSAAIRTLADDAQRIADSDRPVLIQGETGSGKGVLARWLHEHGPRAAEPFVDLNCAGLASELVESELFGHERGAFTGAVGSKPGLLELAHRGTVFLDEIGDLGLQVQPKLLKVLEESRFRRVGSVRDRQVDIRLLSATHQDLSIAAREGRFRSDLFYRINTITLWVPALRDRLEDLPLLATTLLDRIGSEMGRRGYELEADALDALARYPWPGNVRELRNVLERAVLLSRGNRIGRGDLRFESGAAAAPTPAAAPPATVGGNDLRLSLEQLERRHIEAVLRDERGHVARAAVRLGIPRSSLYQKIAKLGLHVPKG
ncbi:sigma-54 dependent transcriptional regulator [Candidatus Binatia bacterium]|nr:sigma-54 dependent transcriptional regulator [Candidatus Binatia bacterium]